MKTDERAGAEYLSRLAKLLAGTPEVAGLYLSNHTGTERFSEAHLHILAAPAFRAGLQEWLAPVGETAYSAVTASGADVVTMDGLALTLTVGGEAPAAGWTPLFARDGAGTGAMRSEAAPATAATAATAASDLDADAAFVAQVQCFWRQLFAAGAALGQEEPFSAHGALEACRLVLLDLYRLALSPGEPGQGYGRLERLPGAGALAGLTEWLVAPLEIRAQWRCAGRLAAAYESLVLPLVERLGLDYPWAMRNLAFRRLEEVRPERGDEAAADPARLAPAAPPAAPPTAPSGPARFKVKRRGRD